MANNRKHVASDHESEDRRFESCGAHVSPPIEICAEPSPTLHCSSKKIGVGRGLELLSEDGCLREERASGATGYSRWKAQQPVAFSWKRKRRNVQARQGALGFWLGCPRSPAFDASAFPTKVRSVGATVEEHSLSLFLR